MGGVHNHAPGAEKELARGSVREVIDESVRTFPCLEGGPGAETKSEEGAKVLGG